MLEVRPAETYSLMPKTCDQIPAHGRCSSSIATLAHPHFVAVIWRKLGKIRHLQRPSLVVLIRDLEAGAGDVAHPPIL